MSLRMIDPRPVLLQFLQKQSSITARVGDRLWAGLSLEEGYNPERDGDAIAFDVRGGDVDEHGFSQDPSFQFHCWSNSDETAATLADELFVAFFDAQTADIMNCTLEGPPQPLPDPDTGWRRSIVFYTVRIRNRG